MPRKYDEEDCQYNRRDILRYTGTVGFAGLGATPTVIAEKEEKEYPVDDRGEKYEGDYNPSVGILGEDDRVTNPADPPDGTIVGDFSWNEEGASTNTQESECSLEIEDDGGIDINFNFRAEDSVTIDCHWKHESGGNLAYLFNDADSIRTGFRAFTNGIAGNGLFFRNVFGGADIPVGGTFGDGRNFQDGQWYQIRIVLDADANTYTVYVNDGTGFVQEGSSFYDGSGFEVGPRFRAMGRESGSSTRVNYDRYVWVNRAIHPPETVNSELLEYPLNDCEGEEIGNEPQLDDIEDLVDDKNDLIADIRDEARDIIGDDADNLDEEAEILLEEIEEEFPEATPEKQNQFNEGVQRQILSEGITKESVGQGPDIAEEIAEFSFSFTVQIVGAKILRKAINESAADIAGGIDLAKGVVEDLIKDDLIPYIDDFIDDAEDARDDILGIDTLPGARQERIRDELISLEEDIEEDILGGSFDADRDGFYGPFSEELEDIADVVTEEIESTTSINLSSLANPDSFGDLSSLRNLDEDINEDVAETFVGETANRIEEQINTVREGFKSTRNNFSLSKTYYNVFLFLPVFGVDNVINSSMEDLDDNINESILSSSGSELRESFSENGQRAVETKAEDTLEKLNLLNFGQTVVGGVFVGITLTVLALLIVDGPSFEKAAVAATVILAYAALLSSADSLADLSGSIIGAKGLNDIQLVHVLGVNGIINFERIEIAIDRIAQAVSENAVEDIKNDIGEINPILQSITQRR